MTSMPVVTVTAVEAMMMRMMRMMMRMMTSMTMTCLVAFLCLLRIIILMRIVILILMRRMLILMTGIVPYPVLVVVPSVVEAKEGTPWRKKPLQHRHRTDAEVGVAILLLVVLRYNGQYCNSCDSCSCYGLQDDLAR